MDPQQLAQLLQLLSPEQRASLLGTIGGGSGLGGGLAPQPMTGRGGQPLSATAAGMVGAGQAAGAPDAWAMTPAQAMSGALSGYTAGRRQQTAALNQQQQPQGQSRLMDILKMLQGQQSYGTTGYAQTPVLGPGGRLGGGV